MSERLTLLPAGRKYEENCDVSDTLCSVFSARLFTNVHSGGFFSLLSFLLYSACQCSQPGISLLTGEAQTLCLISKSHFHPAYCRIPAEISLTTAGNRRKINKSRNLRFLYYGENSVTESLFPDTAVTHIAHRHSQCTLMARTWEELSGAVTFSASDTQR